MKTIEQKAKAYDEALKEAVIAHKDEDRHLKATLERIFPELKESKESEDEKIRKGLIKGLRAMKISFHTISSVKIDDAIDWLEKQCGKIEPIDGFDTEFERQISHLIASAINKEHEYNQGYVKWVANGLLEYAKHELEKQGEHKHTDKVESKFHEGEWITNGDYTWKIVEVKPLDYILQSQDGNIVDDTISHVEEQFHSFTIEDARDGDVIYSRHNTESFEWIGIYKSLDKENKRVFFYGFWHDMAKTFSVCGNEAYVLYDDFSPATKEQRDTLEKAMADAGWEFDFDKKELKKIEEEVNGEDYGIDSLYHAQRILEKTLGKVDGYQTDDGILSHQCAITAVKKLYEQNPSWSEEDEKMFEYAIDIIEWYSVVDKSKSRRVSDWLKYLRRHLDSLYQDLLKLKEK